MVHSVTEYSIENWNLTILDALIFNFLFILALTKCKNSLKPNFRGAKTVKIADFESPDSQKLISRKFLETGK